MVSSTYSHDYLLSEIKRITNIIEGCEKHLDWLNAQKQKTYETLHFAKIDLEDLRAELEVREGGVK